MNFPTEPSLILQRMESVDPVSYARTRNFTDGAVSRLSPYISRGVLSTRRVMESVLNRGYSPKEAEKFLQELAWRDYWQQIWMARGEGIFEDLKHPPPGAVRKGIPSALVRAKSGIQALDEGIGALFQTGYMHNHLRMYLASVACNVGACHWREPARWLYYHLLDGDLASNALSWQWVAGTSRGSRYFANQENINRYANTRQSGTFLDLDYPELERLPRPAVLEETEVPALETFLPETSLPTLDHEKPLLVYTSYNLDSFWYEGEPANRVLILEPEHFRKHPVSPLVLDFILSLAARIPELQVFTGSFAELTSGWAGEPPRYKEHPIQRHFAGKEEPRDWMFPVQGEFPSFFAFWKKCQRYLHL